MSADRDVQNFRANYYHKLGSTTAVEEKRNLAKLLKAVPIDLKKLVQFCQHFHVPNDVRCELWKILLKIIPTYQGAFDYVSQQRTEHFEELSHAVEVMGRSASRNSSALKKEQTLYKMTLMYLIESRVYMLGITDIFDLEEAQLFYDISGAVSRLDFSPCDTYWLSRNMSNLVRDHIHPQIPKLIEKTKSYLQKEDTGGKLSNHLYTVGAFDKLPFENWFINCFANVLPESTFDRVWDKVIAGSSLVLAFIAAALILIYRRPILFMKKSCDILDLFTKVKPDTADEVVRSGIELWHRDGGKLTPSSSRASPALSNSERSPCME